METGDNAVKRLQEIDNATGMVDPLTKRKAEAEYKRSQEREPQTPTMQAPIDGALDDKTLAQNMLAQAKRMEIDAKSMIAEAARMKKDAQRMFPSVVAAKQAAAPVADAVAVKPAATKRGRPAKVLASNGVQ
jgi:hypothetical protein